MITKNLQLYKFSLYGFLKNLRFFEPFMILYLLEKGLSFTQIGILYGFREIVINVLEIPTGIFADIIGRKKTLVLSFSGYLLSFFIFFISKNYLVFFIAMVLFSFGEACRTGTHKAMIFEYLSINGMSDQKTGYYGYTRSWAQIGSALSALVAGIIVFWQGSYSTIFLYSIIPYVLDMLLILSYPREVDGKRSGGGSSVGTAFASVLKETAQTFSSFRTIRIVFNQAFHSGYYKAGKDFIQPIFKTIALSIPLLAMYGEDKQSSVFIGIMYFILFLMTSFASRNAQWFTRKVKSDAAALNATLFAGAVAGIFAGLCYWKGYTIVAAVFYVLVFLSENLRKPAGIAYISDKLKPEAMATTLSTLSQASSVITAGFAFFLGLAIDTLGLGPGIAAVFGVFGILSIFFTVK